MVKTIVGFGDSNTRYWLGDMEEAGRLRDAWPAQLEGLLNACGIPAKVRNEGHPGAQAAFAAQEFDFYAGDADFCILNFGTNDAKNLECTQEDYIAAMQTALEKAAARHIPVAVLGIPWFEETFAGAEAQARLPAWNDALAALCAAKNAAFIDLYTPSADNPEGWFNEFDTPKRHLSCVAHRAVAERILPEIVKQIQGQNESYCTV